MRGINDLGGGKDLGGIEGEEAIIRTQYMRKKSIFYNRKTVQHALEHIPFVP